MKPILLLLEDDEILRETLTDELEEAGYEVDATDASETAAELCYEKRYDLYLLDVEVTGMNGFDLLTALRESGDATPALFLTAKVRAEEMARGFDAGADDYVKKPFDMEELLVRIKSRIRKRPGRVRLAEGVLLDTEAHRVERDGEKIQLQRREYEILAYLVEHRGRIVPKEEVIDALYGEEPISDATFRVYIKNIKKALGGPLIDNVRGVGYRFAEL